MDNGEWIMIDRIVQWLIVRDRAPQHYYLLIVPGHKTGLPRTRPVVLVEGRLLFFSDLTAWLAPREARLLLEPLLEKSRRLLEKGEGGVQRRDEVMAAGRLLSLDEAVVLALKGAR